MNLNLNTNTAYSQFCKNFYFEERIIICGFACKNWTRNRMTIYTSSIQHCASECNAGATNSIEIATWRQFAFHTFSCSQLTINSWGQERQKKKIQWIRQIVRNRLKPARYFTYRQVKHKKLWMVITLHLCVLCGSQNEQQLLPHTSLTDWFL
jgi:hypothetical protein